MRLFQWLSSLRRQQGGDREQPVGVSSQSERSHGKRSRKPRSTPISPAIESFTVMWDSQRCKLLAKWGELGKPIQVIFGGQHTSVPSLSRFKVKPGDHVYPVRVHQHVLYVIARLVVNEIVSLDEYLAKHLALPKDLLRLHLWDLEEKLWKERSELGHRLPYGCVFEAAVGEGTPMTLDCAVPPEMLEAIRYRSQRRERPIRHVKDGKLLHTISIHGGVYRLSSNSATDFANLIDRHTSAKQSGRILKDEASPDEGP